MLVDPDFVPFQPPPKPLGLRGLPMRKFRDHPGRGDLGRARSRLSFPAGCRAQTKARGTGDTTASRRDAIIRRRAGKSADRGPRFLRSP